MATTAPAPAHEFRIYDGEKDARGATVRTFYYEKNSKQTLDYASAMLKKYTPLFGKKSTVLEAVEALANVFDDSDPDTMVDQLQHAMLTGEACRRVFPDQDYLHLTGFIHDLGKVLVNADHGHLAQWEVVGDTYPVGCAFSDQIVYHEAFDHNPDSKNPKTNTPTGIYAEKCGFKNLVMAWGHDEYLYLVLKNHAQSKLPADALSIIRYHSFYPWHNKGAYMHLCGADDLKILPLVQKFQKCDLYSKGDAPLKWEGALKEYYVGLMNKYLPGVIQW